MIADDRISDLDFWLDRLEGVTPVGPSEWFALCPGHPDKNPSLSICLDHDDNPLVHCFAGCSFSEIVNGLDQLTVNVRTVKIPQININTTPKRSGHSLWIDLFGFPIEDLDPFFVGGIDRHLKLKQDRIEFRWPQLPAARRWRLSTVDPGEKGYLWEKSAPHPPLWPQLEDQLEDEIYLTEGESDCIVLRRIGLPAYAITTGGSRSTTPRFSYTIIRDLIMRGVKTIYLAFDDDDVGHSTATVVYNQILEFEKKLPIDSVIDVRILPISEVALTYLGEKDLRQVWLRIRDSEIFSDEICRLKASSDQEDPDQKLWSHTEFLGRSIEPLTWVVRDVIQSGGIGWVSGYPKMGKSWVALDLAFSVVTGTPFLGHFDVALPGDVVYVVKENSDASLVSRISKIMKKKQPLSIQVHRGRKDSLVVVNDNAVMIDATRNFRFEPQEVESLIQKVVKHQRKTGRTVRLIVIDPLSFALPPGKFDINTFTDFQKYVIDPVAHIVRRTGASVVVVHHQNKGDNSTMLGSVAAEASFDNKIMFLTKNRGLGDYVPGDPVRMQIVHRDGASRIFEFEMNVDDDSYDPVIRPVSDDEIRSSAGPKIKISFLERQRAVAEKIESILPQGEFSWREFEQLYHQAFPQDETPSTLLSNAFMWLQSPGNGSQPVIEQHRHGWYRRFQPRDS